MNIIQDADLSNYSTMRLGGKVHYVTEVISRMEIEEAVSWAVENRMPPLMIGGGSNIFWRDEGFDGLLIINKMMRYQDFAEDEQNHYLTIGAGENWDSVVARSVQSGLSGIEALSLIPGTAGATPIQNVGAYGQEIADVLVSVEAYDLHTRSFLTIPASDCAFGYRTSRFKTTDRDRFFISSLTIHLMLQDPQPPFYRALAEYFAVHSIKTYTPQVVRDAVIQIRSSKLPDPAKIANNGSFFANPIVDIGIMTQIQSDYPDIPHWPVSTDDTSHVKIPAAWLIEQAGYKDFHDQLTGMATWKTQPLVLINEHARSTADLLAFKKRIIDAVDTKFQITLEQEPELLP
ncbi:MAG TPA: UDP-N-acetylmuramate dehydrogenase [Candidatus Saccharimonadales bacterium]|jgi:UDP-N-acetylmuramate dehydrogenase